MIRAVILALALLAVQASATQIGFGKCPTDKAVVNPFNAARYMGRWYEIERFAQIWELGMKCSIADYSLDASGKVNVKNTAKILGREVSQSGSAEVTSTNGDAKLDVTFVVPIFGKRTANYYVLDTDYDNFALVFSCSDIRGIVELESAWILGREKTLDDATKAKVEEAIKKAGLKRSAFKVTSQNC